jgi:hypothetical protein
LHGYGNQFSPETLRDSIDRCHARRERSRAFNKFLDEREPGDEHGIRCISAKRLCELSDEFNGGNNAA